jgi:hypothetical protein
MDLVSPGARDALASLAVHEIAELISEDAARDAIRRVAMGSVERAADRILVESARRG